MTKCEEKKQLEVRDVSGGGSSLILKISYAEVSLIEESYALNNDGSEAAFVVNNRKLYIVDVNKEKGSISVNQLAPIDTPGLFIGYKLRYDAKDRLYAFIVGNLWLVEPSKREFISLEEAKIPQGYGIVSSAISPNGDYIALLFQSDEANAKGYQHQMIVKEDAKAMLMRLYRYKS